MGRAARRAQRLLGAPYVLDRAPRIASAVGGPRRLLARSTLDAAAPLTSMLYDRLSDADVAAIEAAIATKPELAGLYRAAAGAPGARRVLLALGVWLGVPAAIESTGLTAIQPPDHVHAMARGPLAAAGGLYEADLIADTLAEAGHSLAECERVLDFGCSSGRVLSVLAAAFPQLQLLGCDPNAGAIAWAAEHLPSAELFVSPQHPPLDLAEGSLDLVYAISIWSHFAPDLGRDWFAEMHRLLRPNGLLLCTTHGFAALHHYLAGGERASEQVDQILAELYRTGVWYAYEFGESGDWGVKDPEWGTSFLSPEWLLTELCPRFRVLAFAPGRNQGNQDVYLLQRA